MSTNYKNANSTLSWTAPTTNANGQPLIAPIVSFNIKIGTASGQETLKTVNVMMPATSITMHDLALTDGVYYADVTAVDAAGNESAASTEASFTLVTVPPAPPTGFTIS